MSSLRAVRSRDYSKVYFVAAELDGPGLSGNGHVAVWATNEIRGYGLTFAVDGYAKQFSGWGEGPGDGFSQSDDGVGAGSSLTPKPLPKRTSRRGNRGATRGNQLPRAAQCSPWPISAYRAKCVSGALGLAGFFRDF